MITLTKFASDFTNAPTLEDAKEKVTRFYKGVFGQHVTVVFSSWYGGDTGDDYGKNFWFNGCVQE
jgi:hypothetical protein